MPNPAPTRLGLIDRARDEVAADVLGAWDAFLAQAEATDLAAPSRLTGWRAHDICVHLGAWPDHAAIATFVAAAQRAERGQQSPPAPDVDDTNAAVTRRHKDATRDEVLDALRRNRQALADYLGGGDRLDRVVVPATVGPLPLLTVLHAQTYELAVHALDLVTCGAPPPPTDLLRNGLGALADVTGALANRCGITGGFALVTPEVGWALDVDATGWGVRQVQGKQPGTSVECPLPTLLDLSAGRGNPLTALAKRTVKVHHMGGLLRFAPIVESVPGIPGGPALRVAARALSGAGGLLGRLSRRH